jgi:hypothetical protein
MHRVLKPNAFGISSYGWPNADVFFAAWKRAGFRIRGHIFFRKGYVSKSAFLQYRQFAPRASALIFHRKTDTDRPSSRDVLCPTPVPADATDPSLAVSAGAARIDRESRRARLPQT